MAIYAVLHKALLTFSTREMRLGGRGIEIRCLGVSKTGDPPCIPAATIQSPFHVFEAATQDLGIWGIMIGIKGPGLRVISFLEDLLLTGV